MLQSQRPRETARKWRERQREEAARRRGGDPEHERGKPRGNQKQNAAFRDATRGLTAEERRALHEEIMGQDLPYEEIEERAKEIIRNRE